MLKQRRGGSPKHAVGNRTRSVFRSAESPSRKGTTFVQHGRPSAGRFNEVDNAVRQPEEVVGDPRFSHTTPTRGGCHPVLNVAFDKTVVRPARRADARAATSRFGYTQRPSHPWEFGRAETVRTA